MLLYPSQDDLLGKIDSKYSLVILAAKRARQLHNGEATPMLEDYKSVKNVGKSLEEIISGDLVIDPDSIEKK
ncbi:DNA-directed RNA polymerase subunit omega [Alkalibacterium sp. 20]|uniref:DNA-directed RNA polymerase subunit omega n=1 Tax=Alkalibacterium sp. 20 TaxID=1798803 RepID=UPI0009000F29|nr:DNA-directed RNA polymerase subunit omega [Alkalibacterium sp. 20]OJF89736.1 DNA-directed RNA polymerase subunit omega [Alkalibacterium sp. 20]